MAEIDSLPVKDLPVRYNIGRTVLYERINALKIKLEKRHNQSFVNGEQLALLDDLNEHIKRNGTTPGFLRQHGLSVPERSGKLSKERKGDNEQIDEQILLLSAIASRLIPPSDPWDDYKQLELIAKKGWFIPTSRLLPLLGRKSIPKYRDNGIFTYKGFNFLRVGKLGNQYQWKVIKP